MSARPNRQVTARADKVLPGLWRIRLPLPWQATPHGNAYAVAAGEGIVLFDTGFGGPDGLGHLEAGLAQAGYGLDDIKLVACTHAHADHFGSAASIVERTGCPIWIHPAWEHARALAEDPDGALDLRLEKAANNGVPAAILESMEAERRGADTGVDGPVNPDRELVEGVAIETDLGTWRTHETPGHAPSHVVFHQPDRRLLLSGDAIVGRVFLFFDHGHTPDPAGEFLSSLDVIGGLDVGLVVSGHGRPFREIPGRVQAYRDAVAFQLDGVRRALEEGPKSAYEIIGSALGRQELPPGAVGYGLEMTLSYLDRLEILGEARRVDGTDPQLWERLG